MALLEVLDLGPEDVSLLERCPHFRGVMYRLQWSWGLKMSSWSTCMCIPCAQVWINQGDIVLIGLRDYQDAKADVILRYNPDEARNLKTYGELPESGLSLHHSLRPSRTFSRFLPPPSPSVCVCLGLVMMTLFC